MPATPLRKSTPGTLSKPAAEPRLSRSRRPEDLPVADWQAALRRQFGRMWELSFHVGPQAQLEMSEDLKRQVAEIDAGTVELVSADDVFEPLYKPGCDALFEALGGRSTREIAAAIRDIDKDQNAAAWLERVFAGAVMVKPQFRKAFRAAGR